MTCTKLTFNYHLLADALCILVQDAATKKRQQLLETGTYDCDLFNINIKGKTFLLNEPTTSSSGKLTLQCIAKTTSKAAAAAATTASGI